MPEEYMSEKEKIEVVVGDTSLTDEKVEPIDETDQHTLVAHDTQMPLGSKEGAGTEPAEELVGRTIGGHFEIQSFLGEGGMGKVYKAKHLLLNRQVALKVLKPHLANRTQTIMRFQHEGQASIGLQHENICAVYELGMLEHTPFLVMEFLEGKSLEKILDEGALPQNRVLELVIQICDALEYAHNKSVIHRDIKPSNIVISEDKNGLESSKLVDFGIAKVLRDDESGTNLTKTGEVFGTPKYMSPEQIEGKKVDRRSDIYSLGCVLYELLMGDAPFTGEGAFAVAYKHVNEPPPAINRQGIDEWLKQVVYKTLEKSPDERYQSISELKSDLIQRSAPNAVRSPKSSSSWRTSLLAIAVLSVIALLSFNIVKTINFGAGYLRAGHAFFQIGYFDEAAKKYGMATQFDKTASDAYLQLGRIKMVRHDFDGALWELNNSIKRDPSMAHSYSMRGEVQRRRGDAKLAQVDLNKAIELYSLQIQKEEADVYAHANRGLTYLRAGDYSKALADFDTAIKLDPSLDTSYNDRGLARMQSGDLEGAIKDLSKAIDLNPENVYAYRDRSLARKKLGDVAGARSDMMMAEKMNPYVNKVDLPPMIREPGRKFIGGWIDPGNPTASEK